MAVVGAFVRIELNEADATWDRLGSIDCVEPFILAEPEKIGLLIETGSLEEAHEILTQQVAKTKGVLGAWPVSANIEDEPVAAQVD